MRRACTLTAASLIFQLMITAQVKQDVIPLDPGQVIERDLSGGQADFFRVTLQGGECADLVVEQRGIDVMIQVLDDANTVTSAFESESRKFGQEQVLLVADTPQSFRIKIRPVWAKASAARYGVQFLRVRSATEKDRLVWEAHKLDLDAIRFEYESKIDEALQASERAVAVAEKALGPDDAYVGELLYLFAFRTKAKGQFNAAEQIFRRALEVDQKAKGRNDPQTAMALRGLADLYTTTGEYSKAESLLEEHVQIMQSTLGSEHPRVALALRMLGNSHKSREDLEGALRYFERASAIAEKAFNPDELAAAAITQDLGNVYNLLGDNERAEPLIHHALDVFEQRFGSESVYVATPLLNLGRIALQRKQLPLALDYYTRSAAIRRKVQGPRHPETAGPVMGIANVYGSMGEFAKALPLHKDAFDIFLESLGPYHEATLKALQNVAKTYAALGDIAAAVEHQLRYDQNLEKNLEFSLVTGSEREKFDYLSSVASQTDRTLSLHARQAPGNATARDLAALVLLQRQGRVLDAMSGSYSALRERLTEDDRSCSMRSPTRVRNTQSSLSTVQEKLREPNMRSSSPLPVRKRKSSKVRSAPGAPSFALSLSRSPSRRFGVSFPQMRPLSSSPDISPLIRRVMTRPARMASRVTLRMYYDRAAKYVGRI